MNKNTQNKSSTTTNILFISFVALLTAVIGSLPLDRQSTQGKIARRVPAGIQSNNAHFAAGAQETPPVVTADDGNILYFSAGPIDTRVRGKRQAPSVAATRRSTTGAEYALHLIQFKGPIQDSWLETVKATGAEPVHYIANYGYLVWANQSSRSQLNRMADENDIVRFSAPYSADLKIDPQLLPGEMQPANDELVEVTIQMLSHEGEAASKQRVNELVAEHLSSWEPVLKYQNMRALIAPSSIPSMAVLPDMVWIGAHYAPERMDEKQAQIVAGNLNSEQTGPHGPGYLDWLQNKGFSDDPADYPIIDFTDDGIGTGIAETAAGDSTFRIAGNPALESRLAYLVNCTEALDAGGPGGHGHLNASIAGGYDTRGGLPYQDAEGYQRGLGVNPFGRLAGTRVFNGGLFQQANCGGSYQSLIRQSYQAGARIISNSWGCTSYSCPSTYNDIAQAYDAGVRDADNTLDGNQEILILFSAGNVGNAARVGSPANAKNVIAVGATENVRPTWNDGCNYGPEEADNAQDIARYSSRGPAPGGRTKPDFVAPGTHVVGVASTAPGYHGNGICDQYHPENQMLFASSTGTSHSVPAVAGIASLSFYWLAEKYGIENPSPALLKAFLAANTRYLSGTGANDDLPSNAQGFGLPDMNRAFSDTSRIIVEQNEAPLFDNTGQTWSLSLSPANRELPVRIVMAFTDQPGAAPTSDPRVNDLDLQVKTHDGIYLGNVMEGPWSRMGGEADQVNNVEAVFLPPGHKSPLQIIVTATNIAGDGVPGAGDETDQDFVLICDNCQYHFNVYFPLLPIIGSQSS